MTKNFRWMLAAAMLLAPASTFAGGPATASASLSANETSIGETLMLTVQIAGGSNIDAAPAPSLPDFQVQPAGQTKSFQWINGETSSMVGYNFVLSPTKTGTLQIPPISVTVDGKPLQTQPILVVVHSGAANPQQQAAAQQSNGGNDKAVDVPAEGLRPMFMTSKVDVDHAYVGQQILLRVQILRRPDIQFTSQPRFAEPDLTGFLVEPLKQQKYLTTINGAQYEVVELPYAIFPTSDGDFAVGGAQMEIAVRAQVDPFDPNSFFQNFFGRSQVVHLNTRSIPVRVRALPKNKPPAFSGAVGRFKLTAKVDAPEPEVGKAVNLVLSVTGVGNIKAIKEPVLPNPKNFRRYETISSSKVDDDPRFLHGAKEFKILLIPQASGNLTIPAAQFAYFDPVANDYIVDTTPEIPLTVKPGTLTAGGVTEQQPDQPQAAASEGIRVLERDIRFIKQGPVRPVAPPLYLRGWFIMANLIPPLFAFAALLVRRQRDHKIERADEYRSRSALRQARRELVRARKAVHATDPAEFYGFIQGSLTGFIADKIGAAAAGLTRDDIERALSSGGLDEAARASVRDLLDRADMARFATSSLETDDRVGALEQAEAALKSMGKSL